MGVTTFTMMSTLVNHILLSLFTICTISSCAEQQQFSTYEGAVKSGFQIVSKDLLSPKFDPQQHPTTFEFAQTFSREYLTCRRQSYQYMNAGCHVPNFEEILYELGQNGFWFSDAAYSEATGIEDMEAHNKACDDIYEGRRKAIINGHVFNPFSIDEDLVSLQEDKIDDQTRANELGLVLAAIDENLFLSVFGVSREQLLEQIDEMHEQYDALVNPSISQSDFYQAFYNKSGLPKFCFYQSPVLTFKIITAGTAELDRLDDVARLAVAQSNTLSHFFGVPKAADIDIVAYKSLALKRLPSPSEPFSYSSVNSARTYSRSRGASSFLLMFREEEFEKVFLHELCHHVLGSKGSCDSPHLARKNLNETFVETLAVASHCSLKASSSGLFDQHHFILCIDAERKFSALQSAKVLLHAGYNSYDEFLADLARQSKVQGIPATIEYHVYKSAMLFNLEPFMVNAKANLDEPNALAELIINSLHALIFKQAMIVAFQVARELGDSELASTMRMTIS